MELVSDKRVFEGFQMGLCLRVLLDVKVRDVRLKRRVDFGHDRIPYPSDAGPFPQLTLLLNENMHEKHFHQIRSVTRVMLDILQSKNGSPKINLLPIA